MEEIQKVLNRLQKLHGDTYLASPAAILEEVAIFMRHDLLDCIESLKQAEIEIQKEGAQRNE